MVEPTNIEARLAALPKPGSPEVGEDGSPSMCLLFRSGRTSIIPATSDTLFKMGLQPYPRLDLTTQHALSITRALATLHAHAAGTSAAKRNDRSINGSLEIRDMYVYSKCPSASYIGDTPCKMGEVEECNGECGDVLTAEITQLDVAKNNLSILGNFLKATEQHAHVVRQLTNLETDLSTLMDFIQFSSAVSKKWIASIGPISACDIWVSPEEEQDIIGIRLRGGPSLRAPPLRDAAWVWLTLIEPLILRERYSELCDEYCNAFNSAYHRLTAEPGQPVQEVMSYFDVMRDLGESFLHAFFTLLHKFVSSGTWYLDRQLYGENGPSRMAAVLEFLIENGIVGNIFIA